MFEPRVYLVGRPSIAREGYMEYMDSLAVDMTTPTRMLSHGVTGPTSKDWHCDTDNDAEILCMTAGKICYDAFGKGRSDAKTYLKNILDQNHGSVLEHAQYNFVITGVSRTFSHEHVRHRVGIAISQRSSRYVKESDSNPIRQELIDNNPEAKEIWEKAMQQSKESYDKILQLIAEDLKAVVPDSTMRIKLARSAARSVLPHATETCIFWSANARALRHYIDLRTSEHAEVEIRRVAFLILKIMQVEAPNIFGDYLDIIR